MEELLKSILKGNEDALTFFAKKNHLSYNGATRKKYIDELKNDGDIVEFIKRSDNGGDYPEFNALARENGLKTTMDMINYYASEINFGDHSSIAQTVKGKKYSTYQICALAANFNTMVGMYALTVNGKDILIVKSTSDGKKYHDYWVEKNIKLHYCFETDDKGIVVKKRPNELIKRSLKGGNGISVFLFTNKSKGEPFVFQGEFIAEREGVSRTSCLLVRK